MSASTRQVELFAGSDWRVLYQAFTQINFNAYDPPTIAAALRQYIQTNYPEDFNDWIESSEFVALIDLLAWLAGSLAFRTDINARENFLETAEARESILRLARFLSYNGHRNQPATGLVKLVSVQTDDDVFDSFGVNLNNTIIRWNDSDNPDWLEQFTLILNNAFISTNPFGIPLKDETVLNAKTQLYRLNTLPNNPVYSFSSYVNGENMNFEICNADFAADTGFVERTPDLDSAFHFTYRNDGNGNASPNTGFFALFKQGSLNRRVVNVDVPLENRLIDINVNDINESDVWVQTINDSGSVSTQWTKVPNLVTDNITFNNIPSTVRNVFGVITRDNDQITLRFSDGRFGAVPVGKLRVWFRTSNGESYIIRPQDMDQIQLALPYTNRSGTTKTLIVTFSLQQSVSNSVPSETDEQIRRRAPQVYGTQNRMVSGEDYNVFPLQSNLAVKLKAVNRVYAGHSRYIDINDPTGQYQDTSVFSDDGIIFSDTKDAYDEVPVALNRTPAEMLELSVQPRLTSIELRDYALNQYLTAASYQGTPLYPIYWYQSTVAKFSTTGAFVPLGNSTFTNPIPVGTLQATNDLPHYITEGALLRFENGGWTSVASISGQGNTVTDTGRGSIQLADPIAMNDRLLQVIPAFRTTLNADEIAAIESKFQNLIPFTLWFNYVTQAWLIQDLTTVPANSIKAMTVEYVAGTWRITTKGLIYVFESIKNVRWFFDPNYRSVDSITGLAQRDLVRVLSINPKPDAVDALGVDYDFVLEKQFFDDDGYADGRRVQVSFRDSHENGHPDDPTAYAKVSLLSAPENILFYENYTDTDSYTYVRPLLGGIVFDTDAGRRAIPKVGLSNGTVGYQIFDQSFWVYANGAWTQDTQQTYSIKYGRGANNAVLYYADNPNNTETYSPKSLSFQWKHYAPSDHRIDPCKTNVHDIFVLTNEYDLATRQWIRNGADPAAIPSVPSELELRIAFSDYENYKMFSDQIVWRPVRYKLLFGNGAVSELRAQFKVIKLPNTTVSDGEIKAQVIRAINTFFDVNNQDFGETFYGTELIAYVHQQLVNVIASFVIVPLSQSAAFGDLFEVRCQSDEIFISTAQVSDVVIINSNTAANLRIK